jgi:GTPase SAR1 family protein
MSAYSKVISVGMFGLHHSGSSNLLLRYFRNEFLPVIPLGGCGWSTSGPYHKDHEIGISCLCADVGRETLGVCDAHGIGKCNNVHETFKMSSVFIICFDVTDREIFLELSKKYLARLKDTAFSVSGKKQFFVLVATKTDKIAEREISTDEAHDVASKYGMEYFETSAKDNTGCEELFDHIITLQQSE